MNDVNFKTDNSKLIESGETVSNGEYICPLCRKIIVVDDNQLPLCNDCHYNYLQPYPSDHK